MKRNLFSWVPVTVLTGLMLSLSSCWVEDVYDTDDAGSWSQDSLVLPPAPPVFGDSLGLPPLPPPFCGHDSLGVPPPPPFGDSTGIPPHHPHGPNHPPHGGPHHGGGCIPPVPTDSL